MILGIHTELFEDQRSRKVLRIKTKDTYYLVPEKKESLVRLLQTNVVNAITLSLIIGMFIKWNPIFYAVAAVAIYCAYLLYFNLNILPQLQLLKEKKIRRKENKSFTFGQLMFQAVAFIFIAVGLGYCIITGQVDEGITEIAVMGGAAIALIFAMRSFIQAIKAV